MCYAIRINTVSPHITPAFFYTLLTSLYQYFITIPYWSCLKKHSWLGGEEELSKCHVSSHASKFKFTVTWKLIKRITAYNIPALRYTVKLQSHFLRALWMAVKNGSNSTLCETRDCFCTQIIGERQIIQIIPCYFVCIYWLVVLSRFWRKRWMLLWISEQEMGISTGVLISP